MTASWTYFVGLVIVLWVVFKDFLLLSVVECVNKFVCPKIFPPFLTLDEPVAHTVSARDKTRKQVLNRSIIHMLRQLDVKLSRSQKSQQGQGVQTFFITCLLKHAS